MVRLITAATLATGASALQQPASHEALVQKHEDRAGSLCGEKILDWALCDENMNSKMDIDNLGCSASDDLPCEMRFANVARVAGVGSLDLVITNLTDWKYVSLSKGHGQSGDNKCLAGINVKQQRRKTQTTINFMLAKHGTNEPLRGGPFDIPFTILDVDSQNKANEEFVLFDDWRAHDTFHLDPAAMERVDADLREGTLRISSANNKSGTGNLSDNPSGRSVELTAAERERAAEIRFNDRSTAQWQAIIGTQQGEKGRHFFFAGGSNIPGTHTTTLCACQEWPANTFDWRLCGDGINGNPVVTNNLGGQGPETSQKPEIRYGGVAVLGGNSLDLVVTAKNQYKPNNVSRNTVITDRVNASIHKCYGAINVANSETVQLQFQFVNAGTDVPASFGSSDSFSFTVYDLDGFSGNEAGEAVTFLDMPSDHRVGEDVAISMQNGNFAVCSVVEGTGSDNPLEDADSSDDVQSRRSASVEYVGTNTFSVELQAIAFKGGSGGRNFLFQGCRMPGKWLEWPEAPYGQSRK